MVTTVFTEQSQVAQGPPIVRNRTVAIIARGTNNTTPANTPTRLATGTTLQVISDATTKFGADSDIVKQVRAILTESRPNILVIKWGYAVADTPAEQVNNVVLAIQALETIKGSQAYAAFQPTLITAPGSCCVWSDKDRDDAGVYETNVASGVIPQLENTASEFDALSLADGTIRYAASIVTAADAVTDQIAWLVANAIGTTGGRTRVLGMATPIKSPRRG